MCPGRSAPANSGKNVSRIRSRTKKIWSISNFKSSPVRGRRFGFQLIETADDKSSTLIPTSSERHRPWARVLRKAFLSRTFARISRAAACCEEDIKEEGIKFFQ